MVIVAVILRRRSVEEVERGGRLEALLGRPQAVAVADGEAALDQPAVDARRRQPLPVSGDLLYDTRRDRRRLLVGR
jgi:hypothetical protein